MSEDKIVVCAKKFDALRKQIVAQRQRVVYFLDAATSASDAEQERRDICARTEQARADLHVAEKQLADARAFSALCVDRTELVQKVIGDQHLKELEQLQTLQRVLLKCHSLAEQDSAALTKVARRVEYGKFLRDSNVTKVASRRSTETKCTAARERECEKNVARIRQELRCLEAQEKALQLRHEQAVATMKCCADACGAFDDSAGVTRQEAVAVHSAVIEADYTVNSVASSRASFAATALVGDIIAILQKDSFLFKS